MGLASNAGTLALLNSSQTFTPGSGTFTNSGNLYIDSANGATPVLTVTGALNNAGGTVYVEKNATITVTPTYNYTQSGSASSLKVNGAMNVVHGDLGHVPRLAKPDQPEDSPLGIMVLGKARSVFYPYHLS